jgi:hypothetical protein
VLLVFRAKASINRFRTKPSEFKAKLQDMFVAYFKAEHQNLPESRAAICRRFQMTPALFSRKLLELSEAEKDEYTAAALAQIAVEGRTATPKLVALAAGSAAAAAGDNHAAEESNVEISARVRTSAMDNMSNSHRGDDFWRTALPSTPSTAAPTPTASAARSPDLTAATTATAAASHSNSAGKSSSSSAPAPPSFAATHGRARKVANAQGAR